MGARWGCVACVNMCMHVCMYIRTCTRTQGKHNTCPPQTNSKSQIQTYLEQNEGPGLQHLALKTDDIITTMREMRQRSACGGFEFMPRASDEYYRRLPDKIGDALTPEQYKEIEELGILADKDDQVRGWGTWLYVGGVPSGKP